MTNQERAKEIADALHDAEAAHRVAGASLKKLHKLLEKHACECPDLDIDVTPLSAGGQK
jgi:hypothetical protein